MFEQKKLLNLNTIKQDILKAVGEDANGEEVLNYLLNDNNNYCIYKYIDDKKTVLQRFNVIWFVPIFFMIMPFKWLFTGDGGVTRSSLWGRAIDKLVGFE